MALTYPKHVELAQLPTPIQSAPRISRAFEGPEIRIKRDDFTGIGCTGNKIRKLEFLMADALGQKADVVITCGGIQSNHARTTAIAATKLGLRTHLVLRGTRSTHIDGNLFINRLVDAEITYISDKEYENVDEIMGQVRKKYALKDKKAYIIPEGGSNAIGAWGYVKATEEILNQIKTQQLDIDIIFCAVGSGGTYAGLLIGAELLDTSLEMWGVNVCDSAEYFEEIVTDIAKDFSEKYDHDLSTLSRRMKIIDGFVGKGYALSSQDEINVVKLMAKHEGILLDPVYTGKAMHALREIIQRGEIKPDKNVLFLHTGGVFGLFPKKNLFF